MNGRCCRNGLYIPRKKLLVTLIILLIGSTVIAYSQSGTTKPPLNERVFLGGSFSIQLGTITNIEISPVAGVWLLPRISVAAGPIYQFYKDPFDRTDMFGARVYTQYVVIQDINKFIPIGINTAVFLHGEYEGLSLERLFWYNVTYPKERFGIHTLLGGFGLNQPVGGRASVNIMVLWAVTENNYGIYDNPEIRVGFVF